MKKLIQVFFLIIFLSVFSSSAVSAASCGANPGEPCCQPPALACKIGLVCNQQTGICELSEGKPGDPCNALNRCEGGECQNGTCVACGQKPGDACCSPPVQCKLGLDCNEQTGICDLGSGGILPDPEEETFREQVLCNGNGVSTAIGCIPVEGDAFLSFILGWAIGIGGGITFILILYAGFIIMTSTGNPERLKGGQQLLTSAIGGLILLVFSIFILRVIGVDILGIF